MGSGKREPTANCPRAADAISKDCLKPPEHGWLEDNLVSQRDKRPIFRDKLAVSFREGNLYSLGVMTI